MTGVPAGLQDALGGRYVLDRELARGGMATVYLARDVKHHRDVAVKVLGADISLAIDVERFRREIAVIASLRHPHIVPLFDSGDVAGQQYYVMPFIAGESLRDRIARDGPLPIPDVRRITRAVAAALEYAHRHGVVHRDVKPGNVLLEDEHAVVTDFGIARRASVDEQNRLTTTGMFIGTPAYMSPEQVTGAGGLDARTDVYSLGCVIFEMLVGRPPFHTAVGQHLVAAIPSARAERVGLPLQVDGVVRRALAKSPDERYSSIREFAEAMDGALASNVGDSVDGAKMRQAIGPFIVRPRRQLALGIPLLVGIVVVGWLGWTRFGAPMPQIQSLAVLPLENLTRDSTQDYFVEGMHDALIG